MLLLLCARILLLMLLLLWARILLLILLLLQLLRQQYIPARYTITATVVVSSPTEGWRWIWVQQAQMTQQHGCVICPPSSQCGWAAQARKNGRAERLQAGRNLLLLLLLQLQQSLKTAGNRE